MTQSGMNVMRPGDLLMRGPMPNRGQHAVTINRFAARVEDLAQRRRDAADETRVRSRTQGMRHRRQPDNLPSGWWVAPALFLGAGVWISVLAAAFFGLF